MNVIFAGKKRLKELQLEFGPVKGVIVLFQEEHGLCVLKLQLQQEVQSGD
jgi:hypothetical protein